MSDTSDTAAREDLWTSEIEQIRKRQEKLFRLLLAGCIAFAAFILLRLIFG